MTNKIMEYRKADSKEHEIISKQIRSKALLYVCLIVPVSPLSLIGMFLSIRRKSFHMKQLFYDLNQH